MRKKMSKKLLAVALSAGMALSLAACTSADDNTGVDTPADPGQTVNPDGGDGGADVDVPVEKYTVITDADGNPIDLGGMEIIVRDWFSDAEGNVAPAANDFEEARDEWREWIQETYNFTIKQCGMSQWGDVITDFVDYVSTDGDDNNYVFIMREDKAFTSAIAEGLVYDLSTLDCLDFTSKKFTINKCHEQFTLGGGVYAMYAGASEARSGVYFNKQVLKDAGIDPESIYDMQADGTWTFDKFEELCSIVQRDVDNDGIDDYYGLCANNGNMVNDAVFSNGGAYVGKNGAEFTYELENEKTVYALNWVVDMFAKYNNHDPEDAQWDYYKEEFKSGKVGFMIEDAYVASRNNWLENPDFELGFVFFPKGPGADKYVDVWSNNPVVIPGCYDADRAWKCAFAWNLYTDMPADYEADYFDTSSYLAGGFDLRAVNETIVPMMSTDHGIIAYHGIIPSLDLGPDFVWSIGWWTTVSEEIEKISQTWQTYIDEANARAK
ncbi:MAG: extracellular solute-binding protein [Lachnospiraceae bacterium]|nr:extracellular solute-binding protein [Lachnospiraceae bacterium]